MANGKDGPRNVDVIEGTAVTASVACLVHCLALPLLTLSLPAAGRFLVDSDVFHYAMLVLIAPFALVAFRLSHRGHGDLRPVLLGLLGLVGLTAAVLPFVPHDRENAVTAAASLILVTAHLWNWRLRSHGA